MRRVFLVLFLSIVFPHFSGQAQRLPEATPESVGLSAERLARIKKVFSEDVEKGKLPGAVVAIARKGKLVYFEAIGFQDKPAGKAMAKDAIFRVYSMTKPWTSVAAMMLVEEGRIQLTDPISKYLPAFKDLKVSVASKDPATGQDIYTVEPAKREPTIQDLLRHTSGIAYDFVTRNTPVKEAYKSVGLSALGSEVREKMTPAEFVERLVESAAREPAGINVGIQPFHRASRARCRGGCRYASVEVSRRAAVQAFEDGRLRASPLQRKRQAASLSLCFPMRASPFLTQRSRLRMISAERAAFRRLRTICVSPRCCSMAVNLMACASFRQPQSRS